MYGCTRAYAPLADRNLKATDTVSKEGREHRRRLRMQNYKFRNNIGPHVRRTAASARRQLQWAHRRAALPPFLLLHERACNVKMGICRAATRSL